MYTLNEKGEILDNVIGQNAETQIKEKKMTPWWIWFIFILIIAGVIAAFFIF